MFAKVSPNPNRILAVNGIITMTDTFIGDPIQEILIEIQNKFTFAYLFLFMELLRVPDFDLRRGERGTFA